MTWTPLNPIPRLRRLQAQGATLALTLALAACTTTTAPRQAQLPAPAPGPTAVPAAVEAPVQAPVEASVQAPVQATVQPPAAAELPAQVAAPAAPAVTPVAPVLPPAPSSEPMSAPPSLPPIQPASPDAVAEPGQAPAPAPAAVAPPVASVSPEPLAAAPSAAPVVAAPAPPATEAPWRVASATTPEAYRQDGALHLYDAYRDRIFKGKMPPLLYAIGVLNVAIDSRGAVRRLDWMRAPQHAPQVVAEIERMVRAAAPFPVPVHMGGVIYTDVWLWDKSGRFQLDTLTEGQLSVLPAPAVAPTGRPAPAAGSSVKPVVKRTEPARAR